MRPSGGKGEQDRDRDRFGQGPGSSKTSTVENQRKATQGKHSQ